MKRFTLFMAMITLGLRVMAQGPGGSTDTIPDGAAYILNDGSTITLSNETISTTTSDYNVVQVTSGNLTLNNCTITKSGDTNSNGTWNLTADAYVDVLVNNGEINKCGYNLTYGSLSGNGTINEGESVGEIFEDGKTYDNCVYSIEGRYLGTEVPANYRGIYIQNGKKHVKE